MMEMRSTMTLAELNKLARKEGIEWVYPERLSLEGADEYGDWFQAVERERAEEYLVEELPGGLYAVPQSRELELESGYMMVTGRWQPLRKVLLADVGADERIDPGAGDDQLMTGRETIEWATETADLEYSLDWPAERRGNHIIKPAGETILVIADEEELRLRGYEHD